MPKIKNKVQLPESKLLKAMAELEDAIEKGDELEDQDPEGGLSTEGAPLSGAAPSGKADRAKKSRGGSSSSSSADDASSVSKAKDDGDIEKMMSASDDASSDDASSDDASSDAPPKKKKHKKSMVKAAADSSSDDASSDDESSDDPAEKSFRDAAEEDETIGKAIVVNDFLEAMTDQISAAMGRMTKSMARVFSAELQAVEGRLNARIDNRVAKSVSVQHGFNQKLATAVAAIGNTVQDEVVDIVKSLVNSPASAPRGKALLSKSEVNQPPWNGRQGGDVRMADGSEGDFSELADVPSEKIGDWLFKKSMDAQSGVAPGLIMAWEAEHYNVEMLPTSVRKALVNDLCK